MPDLAIQIQSLTKNYVSVHALRGVDLEVRQGDIFGFLGPNGAGKTTTISCLLDLFAILILFGALALFLSMALPSRTLAASLTGALLVASYFVTSLAHISDKLAGLNDFSPLKYYEGGRAVDNLNWQHLLGLLAFALLFSLLAWLLFERRDIRVSGTGAWKMPAWLMPRKKGQKGA